MRSPALAAALCLAVPVAAVLHAPGVAQAQPSKPELQRAAQLYQAAEAAMAGQRFDDAARDYAVAYDITKDPILFFKIAAAHQGAGRCDIAVTYYKRYLKEGKPDARYTSTTHERIKTCGGTVDPVEPDPVDAGVGGGADGGGATDGGGGTDAAGAGAVAEPTGPMPTPSPASGGGKATAWISLGVGVALATVGGVMALSAEAAEKDLQDLYDFRAGGQPPAFDGATRERYDELVKQGDRYQLYSWIAFGAAGAAAVTAAVLFALPSDERAAPTSATRLVPAIGDGQVGVRAVGRF